MTTTFPRVPYTQNPVILCSAHATDTPATCEDYYVIDPRGADERGGALARCGDDKCRQANLEYIACVGDYIETVDLTPPAPPAARVFEETCADCGITYLLDPSRRHHCTVPGNPTPYRIGHTVQVPTADGGTVPGSIVNLAQGFGGTIRAEIHARAFGFRTTWKGSDELDRHAAA